MLHFADGERHKFVEVQIVDDVIPEGAERFQLVLANPSSGLELGDNTTGRMFWKPVASCMFATHVLYCILLKAIFV